MLAGNLGLGFTNEGIPWYGAVRVLRGDVPFRDFQSYDPGRYYWAAVWMRLLRSEGVVALRASQQAIFAVGLSLGLCAARRNLASGVHGLGLTLLLTLCMTPLYKATEVASVLTMVFITVRLLEEPTRARHFAFGCASGVIACFGRNFGLYCGVAYTCLVVIDRRRQGVYTRVLDALVFIAGAILGYAPVLAMLAFVPGFLQAFLDANLHFAENRTTNLWRSVPWPWVPDYTKLSAHAGLQAFSMGMGYLLLALVPLVVLVWRRRDLERAPLLGGAAVVSLSTMHYAFSRPGPRHLVACLPALVLAWVGLPALARDLRLGRRLTLLACLLVSLSTPWILAESLGSPASVMPGPLHLERVAGDALWLSDDQSTFLEAVRTVRRSVQADKRIMFAPYWPSLYAALGLESPIHRLWFVLPESLAAQQKMIQDIERNQVEWAFLCDVPLDSRRELAFSRTQPVLWRYFKTGWKRTDVGRGAIPESCAFLRRNQDSGVVTR